MSATEEGNAAGGGASLTREQLLEYIKKQKIQIKKLQNDAVKSNLNSSSNVVTANHSVASPHVATEVKLFWREIKTSPLFYQQMGRIALASMCNTFMNSQFGKFHILSLKNSFYRWKVTINKEKCESLVSINESNIKAIAQLEQKNVKLKALLARTHQASQRNAEDSNLMKQAQKEALDELKSIKQKDESERLLLVESLRVKSIETAFHSDLELVIQKAADDLFHQNKKLLEITKSNSADTLPVTAPSDDRENHVNATRTPSRNTTASSASNSTTKTASIIALQNEIKTLNEKLEQSQLVNSTNTGHIEKLQDSLRDKEEYIVHLRRLYESELANKKELELELELTLAARQEIMIEIENIAEINANKKLIDITNELGALTARLGEKDREIVTLTESYNQCVLEVEKLRQCNSSLLDQSKEISRLQKIITDIKLNKYRYSKPHPVNAVSTGNQELVSYVNELITLHYDALKCSHQSSNDVNSLSQQLDLLNMKYSAEIPYIFNVANGFIGLIREKLGGVVTRLTDEILPSIEAAITRGSVTPVTQKQSNVIQPMKWEAKNVALQAGRDIPIAIPIMVDPAIPATDDIVIEWKYSGDGGNNITLTLTPGVRNNDSVILYSALQSNGEYTGTYAVSKEEYNSTKILTLKNTSLWGQVVLGYSFQLKGPKAVPATQNNSITNEIQELMSKRDVIVARVKEGVWLMQQYGALSQAVMNTNKAALQMKLSDDAARDLTRDSSNRSQPPVLRHQMFNKLVKEMKKKNLIKLDSTELFIADEAVPTPLPLPVHTNGNSRVFSCDSFNIRAADELRLKIPNSVISSLFPSNSAASTHSVTITCNISLLSGTQKSVDTGGRLDFGLQPLDLGFSILQRTCNGTFLQLFPYQKILEKLFHTQVIDVTSASDELVVLFDNTYSWYNSKLVRYCITITATDGTNTADDVIGGETGSSGEVSQVSTALTYSETLVDEFFGLNNRVLKYINTVQQL